MRLLSLAKLLWLDHGRGGHKECTTLARGQVGLTELGSSVGWSCGMCGLALALSSALGLELDWELGLGMHGSHGRTRPSEVVRLGLGLGQP